MSVARLPRLGVFSRLLLVLLLLACGASAVDAQTCTLVVNAPPSACTNAPVWANVMGDGMMHWASISWSITGGYFDTAYGPVTTATTEGVVIHPTGTGPVTVTTRATSQSGCTTADVVTVLPVTDALTPMILAPTEACPNQLQTASIAPPATGSWTNVVWSIFGGTFRDQYGNPSYNATGESVQFDVNPGPAQLYASTQHSSGCPTPEAMAVVNLSSPAAPVINAPEQVCPYTPATASIAPPASGSWQSVSWSITNGDLLDQYGQPVSYLSGVQTVQFRATSSSTPVTLSVNAADGSGCMLPAGQKQIALRTIPAAVINAPAQVCPYTPATASIAPPAEGTWGSVSWWISNGDLLDQYGQPVTYLSGVQTVEFVAGTEQPVLLHVGAIDSFGCMTSAGDGQAVALVEPPAVPISLDSETICLNAYRTATVEGTFTNTFWSITGGSLSSWPNAPFAEFVVTEPTATLTFTGTDANGCLRSGTRVITTTSAPPPQITVSTATLCYGIDASATVTNASTYASITWSISGGGYITSASYTGPSVTFHAYDDSAPVTLTATTTGGACASSASVTIPVYPTSAPSITSSIPLPFCPNTEVTLTASEGASYLWSTGATTRSIVITRGAFLSVDITDANGCVRTANVDASERATPQVAITTSGPTQFCEGGTVVLTADEWNGATYLWSNGATTRSITVSDAGSYSVTATFSTGCTSSAGPVIVTVDPAPVAAITSEHAVICNGNAVRLVANAGGDSYLWSTGSTSHEITTTQPGNYTVTVTKDGCSTTSAPFTVTAGTPPSVWPEPASWYLRACPNATLTTSMTNPEAFTRVKWFIENGTIVGPDDQPTVTFTVGTTNPTLFVRGYSESGCLTGNPVTVDVGPPPSEFLAAARVCAGGTSTAAISNSMTGVDYQWTVTNGTILSYGNLNSSVHFSVDGTGPVTVTATATRDGCSSTTTQTIEVDTPIQPVITAPASVCTLTGHTASMNDVGPDVWYEWTITGGTLTSSKWERTVTFNVNAGAPYARLTARIHNNSCVVSTTADVLADIPTATVSAYETTICPGGSATLSAMPEGASYLWSNGATTRAISVTQAGSYSVTVTSATGCSSTSAPVTITADTTPAPSVSLSPTEVCPTQEFVTATINNPGDYTSLQWYSNGSTTGPYNTPTLTVRRAVGEFVYWVEAVGTTASGCEVRTRVDIPVRPGPDNTITTNASFCEGQVYTASVPDAGPGATYAWDLGTATILSGANTRTVTFRPYFFNNNPLNLYCEITDTGSCMVAAYLNVPVTPEPQATISATTSMCVGPQSMAQVPDNGAGATYLWSISNGTILWGQGTREIGYRANGAGTVGLQATVTVNGCANSDTHSVEATQFTSTISASGPVTFCAGGAVYLSLTDGGAGATYLWSNGATTRQIGVNQSGTYSGTVTYPSGCTAPATNPTTVTVNPMPEMPVITESGPTTFCEGGSVTLTAPEGAASYLWSNGATTRSITVTETNSHYVSVFNESGCQANSNPVSVTVHDAPGTIDTWAYGPTTFCEGGSVMLVASSAGGHNFLWSNGATTQAITVTQSGSYSVTVTNDNGCTGSSVPVNVVVLPAPAKPAVTASGPTTFCAGDSVTLTAPDGFSYLWSNGATTRSIDVQYSSSYSVTVTNAGGCSAVSDPTFVQVNNAPAINWVSYAAVCEGVESSREIYEPVNATAYDWSITNGTITRTEGNRVFFIATASPAVLSVTVTNSSGCTSTATQNVTVNSAATPVVTAGGPTTFCTGGSVTLTSSPAAAYSWSNGATTQSITVSASGSYAVTITNANGCSATSAATAVTVNENPVATISAGGPTTFCAGGSVTLTASAGASYLWSNGATTQSIAVGNSGNYSVTVTSAAGCSTTSASTSVTVNDNPAATINASGPTTFCTGGSVTLTASAGASYAWSNGATTQSITVSNTGSYSVTVTNAAGCSATSAATAVTVNDNPVATINAGGPTTFCTGGSVTLTASAGASYAWSNGATTQSISVSASGNYSVTVTNGAGCSATSAATAVTVNDNPVATINAGGPTTFCSGGSVTLTASAGASYLWSNGATTQSITVADSGNYSVTVTNAAGCSTTSAATAVTVNDNPAATIGASGPTTFCTGGSVTLTASSGASYLWSNGATTQSIVVSTSGNYSVTVTNAAGCSATSAATAVTVNDNPVATISAGGPTTFCAGGSVTLTASAGASYLWSNGATTQSITVGDAGNYSVTVTNAAGCSATSAATAVTVNANPTATITPGGPTTFCTGGSVTLTASAGASYLWSTGATTQAISVSATGNYSVTVTNAAGCSTTSAATSVTVNPVPSTPSINVTGATTFCQGGSVTLTAPAGFAAYQWSSGQTTQSIVVSATGAYSVRVTNASGCTSAYSAAVNVTVNPLPAVPAISGNTSVCPGTTTTLTAPAGFTYLWSTGATTQSITAGPGPYSVTVTNGNGCSRASATVTVTQSAATAITSQPANATTTRNTPVTLNVTATGTPTVQYQWYAGLSGDTSNPVGGITTNNFLTQSFNKKGTYRFWVRVTSTTCTGSSVNSTTATITVN